MLGLFGVVVMWAVMLHALSTERAQALQAAVQNTTNLSRAFEEQIVRSINAVDQTLRYMRDNYQRDPVGFDVAAWTRNIQALSDMTFQISLIDKDGMMIASNLDPHPGAIDLSDREHFRVHRDRTEDELFISKPVMGRASGKWSIQMTRKLLTPDGGFGGVIVVSLDPIYLSRFYDSVDLGSDGVVSLIGLDGIVRASARGHRAGGGDGTGVQPAAIGRSVGEGTVMRHYVGRPSGSFIAPSGLDGITRVTAYRGVHGYPLVVAVGVSQDEVLAEHWANQKAYLQLAGLLTVVLLGASGLVLLRQARLNRARVLLRASEAGFALKSGLLETTLDNMTQGLMMIDAERRVQVSNHRVLEMLGLPATLMAGRPLFDDVLRWQWERGEFGDDGGDVEQWLRDFVLSGGLSDAEQVYERARGNGVVLEIRSMPLPDGGVVRTYTDITLRRQTEEVLRAARDEADRMARVKSEFLATMSHEIRSPMSGLLGVLELLRGTKLDADQAHMAELIQGAGSALIGVLNDILDFSKIEAGAVSVCGDACNLRELVAGVSQPHALAAAGKQVALVVSIAAEVPEWVEFDPLRVRQVLNNLLSNAVKFTAAGRITLRVSVELDGLSGWLRFAVEDSGLGMGAEVLGRLFEPFMQADGSTTRNFGGTGLGLCISRRLAHLLGGELGADSAEGAGSVFTFSLPLVEAVAPAGPSLALAATATVDDWAGRYLVLVADDDHTNRWLTQRQLQRLGLRVDTAEDGEVAFERLQRERYDLVVTDCHMPRMDGVALTRAIRASADPVVSCLPVIGLTADVTENQRRQCEAAGMSAVAIKPLALEMLAQLVAQQLGLAGASVGLDVLGVVEAGALAPAPVFDTNVYDELFPPGDPEGEEWLMEYLASARELLRAMREALPADDAGSCARADLVAAAHRLVGSSLSVGACRLGGLVRALEVAAKIDAAAELRERLDVIADEHQAACAAIGAFLSLLQTEAAA